MVYPIKSKEAIEIAEKLLDYIGLFGPPKIILSDQGTEFNNSVMTEMLNAVGIEHRVTSAYNPRTNGQTERFNRVFVDSLRKFTGVDSSKWNKWIPFVSLAYRSKVHSSTGFTPFELMFGRKMNTFEDWSSTIEGDVTESLINRSKEIKKLVENDYILARESIVKAQESQMKHQNNSHRIQKERLPIGASVYVLVKGIHNKLEPKYRGPFKIIEYAGEGNYILENILKERMADTYPLQRLKLVPPEDIAEDEKFFEVEKVLKHKGRKGKETYFVKWKNYNSSHNSWEPAENFHDKKVLRTWNNVKKLNKVNLVFLLVFFAFLPLVMSDSIAINETIYWCDKIDENTTPILHMEQCYNYQKSYRLTKNDTIAKTDMNLFTRDAFEAEGEAHECVQEEIKIKTYKNFFFAESYDEQRSFHELSPTQCKEKVLTKTCVGHNMVCQDGICEFDGTPLKYFEYLHSHQRTGFKCM